MKKQKSFTRLNFLKKKFGGFTLIELLIVIAIIGLLAGIILASLSAAKDKARIAKALQFSNSIRSGLAESIVGWWNFDEGTGSTVSDNWAENDMFFPGGSGMRFFGEWTEGITGHGFKFYSSAGDFEPIDFGKGIGQGFSYIFWFRLPNTSDGEGTFLCLEDATNSNLEDNLGQTPYGDKGCFGYSWSSPQFNISDTKWHHFAFSKSFNSKLCLDGDCVAVGDARNYIPNIQKIRFNKDCGCDGDVSKFSQGIIIDELIIFRQAFLPEEEPPPLGPEF